ncbi:hypothetical protein [Priestia megaterium]|uniref:hypothetical protein n=1 Tax=Priestia megaterium TaxID=1404 RepID=UPI0034D44421
MEQRLLESPVLAFMTEKEKQKKQGIKKLELELTEDGVVKQAYIEQYAFACNWNIERCLFERDDIE